MARKMENRGGFVEGHDPSVGKGDFANLPSEPVMKLFPKNRMHPGGYLDDTISDIDAIQTDSEREIQRKLSHQK